MEPPASVTLVAANGTSARTTIRLMREALRLGGPHNCAEPLVQLAHGVCVSQVMLALNSPTLCRPGRIGPSELQHITQAADPRALVGLRELVHLGCAEFREKEVFYEVFRWTDELDLPQCHNACLGAAASSREPNVRVAISEGHEQVCAERLETLFRSYPRSIPFGLFDSRFVSSGLAACDNGLMESPMAQAHRLVLAAVSPYLSALSEREPGGHWCIKVAELDPLVLSAVLEFTYTGTASVPLSSFNEVAFQADAWGFDELSHACTKAVFANEVLANGLRASLSSLPSSLLVAVACSLREVIPVGDMDAFVACVSSPVLSCALAYGWPPPLADLDPALRRKLSRHCCYFKGLGKGAFGKSGRGEDGQESFDMRAQLERFILQSTAFLQFLQRPEIRRFPFWSVAMVLETSFRGEVECFSNFRLTEDHVDALQVWVREWAACQSPEHLEPSLMHISGCPQVHHLLRLRTCVWGRQPSSLSCRKVFWDGVFQQTFQDCLDVTAAVLSVTDAHLEAGRRLNARLGSPEYVLTFKCKGGGRRSPQPEQVETHRMLTEWRSAHQVIEIAFRVAAANFPGVSHPGHSWPWSDLSCSNLVRLVASTELPLDDACQAGVRDAIHLWLAGSQDKADGLLEHMLIAKSLLSNPVITRKSPKAQLQYTIHPDDVVHRFVSLLGIVAETSFCTLGLSAALRNLAREPIGGRREDVNRRKQMWTR